MAHFHEGGPAMFDALVYSRPHEQTVQFIQQQAASFYNNLTDAGRQFTEAARSFYDSIGLSYGANQLKALGRTIQGMWKSDTIREMRSLEDLQQASPAMQRWIMAEPGIRSLFHKQRVDGYSNRYVDYFPNDCGEEHYDYRMAMNGVVVESDDGSWKSRTYVEELIPGDQKLSIPERNDIQNSWDLLRSIVEETRDDPVSPDGNERG